ncbi:MAG: tectonin domain-containing protein, partial [Thalassolituus sp.]
MISRLCVFVLSIFLVSFTSLSAAAEHPLSGITHLQWQQLRGQARSIEATKDDVVYALGIDQKIYRWRQGRGWLLLPGNFDSLIIDAANKPWGIDTDGVVRRFNGLWWDEVSSSESISKLSASPQDESIYALTSTGQVLKWTQKTKEFTGVGMAIPATGTVQKFLVSSGGELWVLKKDGTLYVNARPESGSELTLVEGNISDLTVDSSGSIVAVSAGGSVIALDNRKPQPVAEFPRPTYKVSFAGSNTPWFIDSAGSIFTTTSLMASDSVENTGVIPVASDVSSDEVSADTEKASDSAKSAFLAGKFIDTMYPELRFIRVNDTSMLTLDVTESGSVFGITPDFQIERWRNRYKDFSSFPGVAKQLTTDSRGLIWVINPFGKVYRLDSNRWHEIPNFSAERIVATSNGEVFA